MIKILLKILDQQIDVTCEIEFVQGRTSFVLAQDMSMIEVKDNEGYRQSVGVHPSKRK